MTSQEAEQERLPKSTFKDKFIRDREAIRMRFMEKPSGLATAKDHARLMDETIQDIYAHQINESIAGICLVAVGGYGRGRLCPYSDVDLLVLVDEKNENANRLAEKVLYPLWDMGLKIGHSVRSVDECIRLSREDITIRTSILDSRYLAGDRALVENLWRRYISEVVAGTEKKFIDAKLEEMEARHLRMGDSRYFLEPNIKESKGGFRDIDTLYWIMRNTYAISDIAELVKGKRISNEEAKEFHEATEFLLKVRSALHYLAGRAEERLTFDSQTHIAKMLGFKDAGTLTAAERFMKKYFLIAARVGRLTRVICAVLEQEKRKEPRFSWKKILQSAKNSSGFEVKNARLALNEKKAVEDPREIVRLFKVSAETGMDITPESVRFILRNNHLINRKIGVLKEVSEMLIDILCARKDAADTLRLMADTGVLGRIIPEFSHIRGQMQYDLYHVFTVDEHTINAISIIHDIENGEFKYRLPLSTEVIQKVQQRHVLYLAMLLHDIGKGRGGRQLEMGESLSRSICRRLGLPQQEVEAVCWLVANHLLMTSTVFKRDIEDPSTAQEFVRHVKSPERLNELLIITVADIMAVGPNIWNDWKATLLRQLYSEAKAHMTGESAPEDKAAALSAARDGITEAMKGFPKERLESYLANSPPNYLLYYPPLEHARLAALLADFYESAQEAKVSTRIDAARSVTELTIITKDRAGLFSLIAGALSLSGANILSAKAFTMRDSTAIDIFTAQNKEANAFAAPDRLAKFVALLHQALKGEVSIEQRVSEMKGGIFRRASTPLKIPNQVLIDQNSNPEYTIVEVGTADRLGLLYRLSRTISDLGFSIENAHISTYGKAAVDVFYLADKSGHKIKSEQKIETLKIKLLEVLGK